MRPPFPEGGHFFIKMCLTYYNNFGKVFVLRVRKEKVKKMNIYDQFQLPIETGERKNAILNTVTTWFAHEDCASEEDIIHSLRSLDDICSNRPAPVSSKQEILNDDFLFYKIAFKFRTEIENTLQLNY